MPGSQNSSPITHGLDVAAAGQLAVAAAVLMRLRRLALVMPRSRLS